MDENVVNKINEDFDIDISKVGANYLIYDNNLMIKHL